MANLSDTFKYISCFRHAGHQVGRKVGDMLEVLTYAALARNSEIAARLQIEPKLYGYSEAGHKVEFIINREAVYDTEGKPIIKNGGEIRNTEEIVAFVECKKVGVEQTINTSFKKKFNKNGNSKNYIIPFGEELSIKYRNGTNKYRVVFEKSDDSALVKVFDNDEEVISDPLVDEYRLIFALCEDRSCKLIGNQSSLRDLDKKLKDCRILEINGYNDKGALALLNNCLAGPQTPEKAKQSSFVALDVRKRRYDSFDMNPLEKDMLSILVLTEFSHWEEKSQNMINACIDINLVVEDELIVEAFMLFEDQFGSSFYDMITKDNLLKDENVRRIAFSIVDKYEGKFFRDIKDDELKKFIIDDGRILVTS